MTLDEMLEKVPSKKRFKYELEVRKVKALERIVAILEEMDDTGDKVVEELFKIHNNR